jgi:hypothetical protein
MPRRSRGVVRVEFIGLAREAAGAGDGAVRALVMGVDRYPNLDVSILPDPTSLSPDDIRQLNERVELARSDK